MRIVSISQDFRGASVTVDAPIGATVLEVDTTVDFSDVGAGELVIANGTTPLVYASVDEDAATITLAEPLTEAVDAGTGVRLWDSESGATTVEYKAGVVDEDGESFTAILPHTLIPLSGLGALIGASVSVDDDLRVVEVYGREGVIDGTSIDPTTLPDPTVPTEPPADSPALEAAGTPRTIVVQAENVDVGTVIDYHLGTSAGFTPDATTLVRSTAVTIIEILTLPDGGDLDPTATYYLKAIAHNVVGPAPVGPEVEAQLRLADSDTILELTVSKLVGGTLTGATILAGMIAIGLITIDPDNGIVVPGGITIPANGNPIELIAHAVLKSLTVEGNASLFGMTQLFGVLRASNGVTNPTVGPTPGRTWPSLLTDWSDATVLDPAQARGMVEMIGNSPFWLTVFDFYGAGTFRAVNKTTGELNGFVFADMPSGFHPRGGVTTIGTSYYVLGQDGNRGSDWYVYKFDTTLTKTGEWYVVNGQSLPREPTIGNDGTNVLLGWVTKSAVLQYRKYSTAGTDLGTTNLLVTGSLFNLGGIHSGITDIGDDLGPVATISVATTSGHVYQFFTTGTRWPEREWDSAGSTSITGFSWDGTRFRSLDGSGRIWDYSKQSTTAVVNVAHAWYDGNPDNGEHRTMASPHTPWAWAARSWLTVTTPPPPDVGNTDPLQTDKADRVLVYAGVGAVRLQQTLAVGVTSITPLDVLDTGSAAPSGTNEFESADAAAGQAESTASNANGPLWVARGDGHFHAWKNSQAGSDTAVQSASTSGFVDVTFDVPFDAAPAVIPGVVDTTVYVASVTNVTAAGCRIVVRRIDNASATANVDVSWIAHAK